ncbi:minor tail protein [Gordonia phage Trine]|uniref:Minor tail protein n=1 Tax=Gordonia phage Trine TaxID=2201431 RepID=A0A2Z4Q8Z9_9CAUD|nr:minor tail protein [Gordonia phage Trine]AWY06521.1 hypothetical protein PBI_TRINE_19 [Gordonia phage Trine]
MPKYMEPDGDVFDPDMAPSHPWEDLFRDIPLKWERVPGSDGLVYRPGGPGVLSHPTAPAQLAIHAELCGLRLHPEEARVRRVDPVRGGRSLTSPGIWQDVKTPVPEGDPVTEVLATAVGQNMTPAEMARAAERLMAEAKSRVE